MATFRVGRFDATLPFTSAGPYLGFGSTWDNDDPAETISQEEWEAAETRKKLWIGGIVTAIIAVLALKP